MDLIASHLVPFLGIVLLGAVGLCGAFAWQLTAPLRASHTRPPGPHRPAADRDVGRADEP